MNHPESKLQKQCVKWAHDYFAKLWPKYLLLLEDSRGKKHLLPPLFSIPNERKTKTGKHLNAMGRKSGVPDLRLDIPMGGYHGLIIEMKSGDLRPFYNQKQWLAHYDRCGYKTAVCRSFAEFERVVVGYMTKTKETKENKSGHRR